MEAIDEFDFNSNDLEDSWCVVDEYSEHDTIRISEKIQLSSSAQLVNPLSISDGRYIRKYPYSDFKSFFFI